MRGKSWATAVPLLCASLAGCEYQFSQDAGAMQYSFGNASSQTLTAISGSNGLIVVNGDTVRVSGGTLLLNGVSYGKVTVQDLIEYRVRDGKKSLTVNGIVRQPERQSG